MRKYTFLYFRVFPFLIIHVYHFYLCMVWDYFEMSYQIRLWKESLNTDINKRIITPQFNKKKTCHMTMKIKSWLGKGSIMWHGEDALVIGISTIHSWKLDLQRQYIYKQAIKCQHIHILASNEKDHIDHENEWQHKHEQYNSRVTGICCLKTITLKTNHN
jgi:hypothetical protein